MCTSLQEIRSWYWTMRMIHGLLMGVWEWFHVMVLDYFNRSVNKSKLYQIRLTLHTQFQPLSTTFRFYYPSIRQFIQRAASLCRTYYFCVMRLLHSSSNGSLVTFLTRLLRPFFDFWHIRLELLFKECCYNTIFQIYGSLRGLCDMWYLSNLSYVQ